MSINLRTGQPGHGKSYAAVRLIRDALESGRYIATNVPLTEGWARTMARTNWLRRVIPGRVDATAAEYSRRLYHVDELADLRRLRLPPCERCPGCKRGSGCRKEGRGLAVLDEAHRWLNSRTWDADESGQASTKAAAVKRRLAIVGFFSTHRHYGWDIELITQDEQNLDRQVRSLFETHTHMKNMRRFRVFGLVPLFPMNVFVGVRHWHDNDKTRLGMETYLLNRRLASCYDTFGAARGGPDDSDVIVLGDHDREQPGAAQPAPAAALALPATIPPAPQAPAERPREVHAAEPPLQSAVDVPSGPLSMLRAVPASPLSAESPPTAPAGFPANPRDRTPQDGDTPGYRTG